MEVMVGMVEMEDMEHQVAQVPPFKSEPPIQPSLNSSMPRPVVEKELQEEGKVMEAAEGMEV